MTEAKTLNVDDIDRQQICQWMVERMRGRLVHGDHLDKMCVKWRGEWMLLSEWRDLRHVELRVSYALCSFYDQVVGAVDDTLVAHAFPDGFDRPPRWTPPASMLRWGWDLDAVALQVEYHEHELTVDGQFRRVSLRLLGSYGQTCWIKRHSTIDMQTGNMVWAREDKSFSAKDFVPTPSKKSRKWKLRPWLYR